MVWQDVSCPHVPSCLPSSCLSPKVQDSCLLWGAAGLQLGGPQRGPSSWQNRLQESKRKRSLFQLWGSSVEIPKILKTQPGTLSNPSADSSPWGQCWVLQFKQNSPGTGCSLPLGERQFLSPDFPLHASLPKTYGALPRHSTALQRLLLYP